MPRESRQEYGEDKVLINGADAATTNEVYDERGRSCQGNCDNVAGSMTLLSTERTLLRQIMFTTKGASCAKAIEQSLQQKGASRAKATENNQRHHGFSHEAVVGYMDRPMMVTRQFSVGRQITFSIYISTKADQQIGQ